MSTDIKALVARLEAAKDAYYNGKPIISDAEYDALEDELRALDPAHPFFAKVGASPSGGAWPKVKHSTPMGSLNKAQEAADLTGWYGGLTGAPGLLLSEKLDGISLNLRYEQRRLVQGLTRGDGVTGEDITRNVMLMQGAVKMLPATMPDGSPTPDLVFVRGEVITLHTDFKAHFIGDSNPRNTASGHVEARTGRRQVPFLTIKRTSTSQRDGDAGSKAAEFKSWAAGFLTPTGTCGTDLATWSGTTPTTSRPRALLDYDIDGLVVEIDNTKAREFMGEHNMPSRSARRTSSPEERPRSCRRPLQVQPAHHPVAEFDVVTLALDQSSSSTPPKRVERLKLFIGCVSWCRVGTT